MSYWIEMFANVAKENIKKELLDGRRPTNMQEWSLQFQLKNDADDVENELVDRVKCFHREGE